jgi:hypothetical protein
MLKTPFYRTKKYEYDDADEYDYDDEEEHDILVIKDGDQYYLTKDTEPYISVSMAYVKGECPLVMLKAAIETDRVKKLYDPCVLTVSVRANSEEELQAEVAALVRELESPEMEAYATTNIFYFTIDETLRKHLTYRVMSSFITLAVYEPQCYGNTKHMCVTTVPVMGMYKHRYVHVAHTISNCLQLLVHASVTFTYAQMAGNWCMVLTAPDTRMAKCAELAHSMMRKMTVPLEHDDRVDLSGISKFTLDMVENLQAKRVTLAENSKVDNSWEEAALDRVVAMVAAMENLEELDLSYTRLSGNSGFAFVMKLIETKPKLIVVLTGTTLARQKYALPLENVRI